MHYRVLTTEFASNVASANCTSINAQWCCDVMKNHDGISVNWRRLFILRVPSILILLFCCLVCWNLTFLNARCIRKYKYNEFSIKSILFWRWAYFIASRIYWMFSDLLIKKRQRTVHRELVHFFVSLEILLRSCSCEKVDSAVILIGRRATTKCGKPVAFAFEFTLTLLALKESSLLTCNDQVISGF